ncbi:MAG: hypothetical protein LIO44_01040 [Eubacterium sp.]|nr:hypothetical protein [Eubacterium sp.]
MGFSFKKLLKHLHKIEFIFTIPMDDNRAADGRNLRWRFGYEKEYDPAAVQVMLDCRPCSVLEMMIALAVRCEEHIMGDPEIGDRTGLWFWCMLQNLYLDRMYDSHYDEKYVDEVISKFLNREYEPDGEGGLFTVRNCGRDLRNMEIWSQMCLYLNRVA